MTNKNSLFTEKSYRKCVNCAKQIHFSKGVYVITKQKAVYYRCVPCDKAHRK